MSHFDPNSVDHSDMFASYILCGMWRHYDGMCLPGTYRVVICLDGADHYDAVMDDFGNLVRVS